MYIQIKSDEGVLNAWKAVRIHSESFVYTLLEVHGNCLDLEEEHMSGRDLKEASENCNCPVKGGAYWNCLVLDEAHENWLVLEK